MKGIGINDEHKEGENSNVDEIEDLDDFVFRSAPQNVTMKCRITRDKKGIDRGIFPTYFLHLERDDGRKVGIFLFGRIYMRVYKIGIVFICTLKRKMASVMLDGIASKIGNY